MSTLNVVQQKRENTYLPFTKKIEEDTSPIYAKLKNLISKADWEIHAPLIDAINKLKKERNAIILVHNYQTPEIFHGIADVKGDSLKLALEASKTDASIIVMAGVHFMAETAKLLNPGKTVLIPDLEAGCSLASSITAEDIIKLKAKYPGVPVVTYVNTSAAVKAESDICCTSANAVAVVESLGVNKVIFLPDEYLGKWVATQTDVELITWQGHCEVHERFTPEEIEIFKIKHPGTYVISHPECPPNVLDISDYVGSTSGMIKEVSRVNPKKVLMITECSMSDNVSVEFPDTEFLRPCNLCPHMKRITLSKIYKCLLDLSFHVEVPEEIAIRARAAVERMIKVPRSSGA